MENASVARRPSRYQRTQHNAESETEAVSPELCDAECTQRQSTRDNSEAEAGVTSPDTAAGSWCG